MNNPIENMMSEHACRQHEPGDRSCASNHGCRCDDCRQDHADYNRERDRRIAQGRWQPYVDAEPVRDHVRRLRDAGMGTRAIAERSGVSRSTLYNLEHGKPERGQGPPSRVTADVARRLQAVDVALRPGALVDSAPYAALLRMLVGNGWTKRALAERLDMNPANFSALLRRDRIRADTAERIRALAAEPSPGQQRHRLHHRHREREVATQRRRQARATRRQRMAGDG